MDNSFVLDGLTWSFSSINSYNICPMMFYLQYIEYENKEGSPFGEFGSLVHSILERYNKGQLELFDLSNAYQTEFDKFVKHSFPPNKYVSLKESYFDKGLNYFNNFDGFDDYESIDAESKHYYMIDKYKFISIIDHVVKDEKGIILRDYKTKGKFKNKKEKSDMFRQLYLNSIPIEEKYGEYPYKLVFDMVMLGEEAEEEFTHERLEEAKTWALDTIDEIYKDQCFKCNKSQFFCDWICSVSGSCKCSNKYLGE